MIRFDLPLLQSEFAHAGFKLNMQGVATIDAMDIFHKMEPRDLKAAYTKYWGNFDCGTFLSFRCSGYRRSSGFTNRPITLN
ncbi:MAG: hypothetical protein Ct9H300mP27_03650 [Chloroflexota bacterium]|nr:MAG: hypothetical protein Ct9H300mP27_03650 [Chloroflexota bacterium]